MKNTIFMFLLTTLTTLTSQALTFSPPEVSGEIVLSAGLNQITLGNNTATALPLSLSVSQTGASISINRCNVTLNPNKTCTVTISINNSTMPVGDTVIPLLNNGTQTLTNLKYSKAAPLEFSQFSQTSISISDFSQKTITITNKTLSNQAYSPTFSGADASKFSIVLNRCSSVNPNASCQITYKLNPQAAGSYSASLTEPKISAPAVISATISGSTSGVIPPSVTSISVSTSSLNFGTLARYGLSVPQTVIISNTGNTSVTPIIELTSKMGFALNRCSTLGVGQSCSVSVGVNPDSSTPNGPILNQSVTIKKNSGDTGSLVSVSADLNVIASCPFGQHSEGGSCVSNVRSCSISNGSGTQSWASGIWSACSVVSCNSGYYQNANSCALITYTGLFSSYSPDPASVAVCSGTVISSRTVTSCMRDDNFQLVATSNCIDLAASISTQSPAGNVNVSIANGSETRSCALGSTTQIFESRSCNSGFYDDSSSCQAISYIATYSSYVPEIPTTLNACDGTVTSLRSISQCNQAHDNALVSNSFCSDSAPSVNTESPAGNVNVSIANGSEVRSCSQGSTTQNFVSRTCDLDFHDDGNSCVADTYIATFSDYSPAIPSSLNVCDGEVISLRNISQCVRSHDSSAVSLSLCNDPSPSVTTQSPAGNVNVSIANGSEIRSCSQGSSIQSFVSRSCDSGFYDDTNNSCQPISYVATFSNYTPEVPAVLLACDGTVTSNRTITQCNQLHDNAVVSNSLCTDPTPQVITQSPAGNFDSPISNGFETRSCAAGSTTQTFVSRTCNANYTDDGSICSSNITNVDLGQTGSSVLNSAGRLYLFGTDGWGIMGKGTTAASPTPTQPTMTGVLAGKTIKESAMGPSAVNRYNTMVIGSDNLLYGWGSNLQGSLGINSTTAQTSPVAVLTTGVLSGKTILKVATGNNTTCAIASDGKVYCWGRNTSGELGIGSTTPSNSLVPVAISGSSGLATRTATEIYGGFNHMFAKTSDGLVWSWGDNSFSSQLCRGGSGFTPTAINSSGVLAGKTIIGIYLQQSSTFIHTSDGKLYGCGANNQGQLGINSTTASTLPTEVSTANFAGQTITKFSAGSVHSCLLASNNFVYCWGQNLEGKTGLGLTTGNTILPTKVTLPGNITASDVKVGVGTSYALGSDNKPYSWGSGFSGALGNGSTTAVSTPVAMTGTLSTLTTSKIYAGGYDFCALTNLNKLYCNGQGVGSLSTPTLMSVP